MPTRFKYLLVLFVVVLGNLFPIDKARCAATDDGQFFRVGFSTSVFTDLNRNDSMAAARIWGKFLLEEAGIDTDPDPIILDGISEIRELLANEDVGLLTVTADEYLQVRDLADAETVTLNHVSGSITEEYLLLVSRDRDIETLTDLQGQRLRMASGTRDKLAVFWIETLLLRENLPVTANFFGAVDTDTNVGKVVLPVFFGTADACVVTRKGFDTMVELNPQVGQKLKVIAVSPSLVPALTFLPGYLDTSLREKLLREITNFQFSTYGKQCLTMFQCDCIEAYPVSILSSTMDLLTEHEQLLEESTKNTANR